MCKEQCVPLRNAGERLGITILVCDKELFLVIMGLKTKYLGFIPLFSSSSRYIQALELLL